MAYFRPRHEVVMWGDFASNSSNDTWAWDGTNWTLLQAGTANPATNTAGKGGAVLGPMSPEAADALIRRTVTTSSPLLLPTALPPQMEALVYATPDGFNVEYRSDQRDKDITLGIVVPNPPPGGPNSSLGYVNFRSGMADYEVYDVTGPLSSRWLMWIEPGTMAVPQTKQPGVPYFLTSEGLTDQEFWQVANSLK
jgi:hypothetical protein